MHLPRIDSCTPMFPRRGSRDHWLSWRPCDNTTSDGQRTPTWHSAQCRQPSPSMCMKHILAVKGQHKCNYIEYMKLTEYLHECCITLPSRGCSTILTNKSTHEVTTPPPPVPFGGTLRTDSRHWGMGSRTESARGKERRHILRRHASGAAAGSARPLHSSRPGG